MRRHLIAWRRKPQDPIRIKNPNCQATLKLTPLRPVPIPTPIMPSCYRFLTPFQIVFDRHLRLSRAISRARVRQLVTVPKHTRITP
jgi:hypothetical protein